MNIKSGRRINKITNQLHGMAMEIIKVNKYKLINDRVLSDSRIEANSRRRNQ